ncbi:30S ribosomal protein S9 [Candidatus Peregrinibacteria bacterium]|nr:30S ribosomal protein S9 [Candidatus Peregrinibacteria bacterium]
MTHSRSYLAGLGKRKTARARVKLYQDGSGEITINGLKLKEYFSGFSIENAKAPLALAGIAKTVDVEVRVSGGGKAGQSDAVRHGISRALLLLNPDFRPDLKRAGFLRRDARIKERKKPGLKRARRAPQFSKR